MTIDQMIERLEEYREEMGGDAEVLLMTQENWPFENRIAGLASTNEMEDQADEEEDTSDIRQNTVYLVEGGQLRYGTKLAWDVAH